VHDVAQRWPQEDCRIPYWVFLDKEVYDREQERIFRGPTWSFLAMEAEIPHPGDFKSTYVGDTPVVVTRDEGGGVHAWVNRCAHRGAMVCRQARGNTLVHKCVYHQWSYDARGNLRRVTFQQGLRGVAGMPADFKLEEHGLARLRAASYRGLVFGTFSPEAEPLEAYLGEEMRPWIDRLTQKPLVYLGCTRQFSNSNWKLYLENVKDPFHASLLHLFHTTFNIFRANMRGRSITDRRHGLHNIVTSTRDTGESADAYRSENIRTYDDSVTLADPSILDMRVEFGEPITNHIQAIFPSLIVQQIHNTLALRQILPKSPTQFELVFHFFGYEDDDPELRAMRVLQANLVGPAGYISMEDTEATELVQRAIVRDRDKCSILDMGRETPEREDTLISETMVRKYWQGYRKLMGY
jgi:anthranilate 1,2-dioxygenase large subunit